MTQPTQRDKTQTASGQTPEEMARDAVGRGANAPAPKEPDRSINDRPVDPNAAPAKVKLPPGVEPEEVRDPGRQTPDAPPVDNRGGEQKKG